MQRERTRHIIKVLEPGILSDDCRHPVMGFGQVFPRIQYSSHDVEGKYLFSTACRSGWNWSIGATSQDFSNSVSSLIGYSLLIWTTGTKMVIVK